MRILGQPRKDLVYFCGQYRDMLPCLAAAAAGRSTWNTACWAAKLCDHMEHVVDIYWP